MYTLIKPSVQNSLLKILFMLKFKVQTTASFATPPSHEKSSALKTWLLGKNCCRVDPRWIPLFCQCLSRQSMCRFGVQPTFFSPLRVAPVYFQAGLAVLLKSEKLFHSSFHSQAVHIRPVCQDGPCKTASLELRQTLNVVFDLHASGQGKRGLKKTVLSAFVYNLTMYLFNFANVFTSLFRVVFV